MKFRKSIWKSDFRFRILTRQLIEFRISIWNFWTHYLKFRIFPNWKNMYSLNALGFYINFLNFKLSIQNNKRSILNYKWNFRNLIDEVWISLNEFRTPIDIFWSSLGNGVVIWHAQSFSISIIPNAAKPFYRYINSIK